MSKLGILFGGIIAVISYFAIFTEINLVWYLADFLLTGQVPYFEFSFGFIGSLIVLSIIGAMIGRIFYDARSDLYNKAVEGNKKSATMQSQPLSIVEALQDEEDKVADDSTPEEDLEEALA